MRACMHPPLGFVAEGLEGTIEISNSYSTKKQKQRQNRILFHVLPQTLLVGRVEGLLNQSS